ncbi:MAG: hypothetical protein MPK10_02845 [Gammaproteobacteria bacterium]|nr:hypothetical protein [Gammaproteobacteria bacterium]
MKARRAGGREARKALRAAPLAEDSKPVRPGESGGRHPPPGGDDIRPQNETPRALL